MKITNNASYVKTIERLTEHQKKSFEGTLKTDINTKVFKQLHPKLRPLFESLQSKQKALDKLAADQIAKKIARGDLITEEEREKLRATDPEKLRKADEANERRRDVSQRLARARTKDEARAIIASEKVMAFMIYDKGDEQYGELFIEAVGKAEADYYENKQFKPASLRDADDAKRERLFDLHS